MDLEYRNSKSIFQQHIKRGTNRLTAVIDLSPVEVSVQGRLLVVVVM